MKIKLNGRLLEVSRSLNVASLLLEAGYDFSRVAVMLNGDIIPRPEFEKQVVNDSDSIEVVSFVGGG